MSTIAWTDHTTNVQIGCSRVSPGCQRCYAEAGANSWPKRRPDVHGRYLKVIDGKGRWNGELYLDEAMLAAGPTTPKSKKTATGWRAPRVFLGSMTDHAHEKVTPDMFAKVVRFMSQSPGTIWQVVTKRPFRMTELLRYARRWGAAPSNPCGTPIRMSGGWEHEPGRPLTADPGIWWPRIHLLTTVEDQQRADERVPHLLECEPYVELLGLSVEPLLERVTLKPEWYQDLGWVIVGGESGPKARECKQGWIRSIVWHAAQASTACFVKQMGSSPTFWDGPYEKPWPLEHPKGGDPSEWPADLQVREFPR